MSRIRRKQNTPEWLAEHRKLVELEPQQHKGVWKDRFGNTNPIHVELGMGKGKFISQLSHRNRDINYIGIDMYDELIRKAGEKAMEQHGTEDEAELDNLCLVRFNIEQLEDIFAQGEVERIYLNFSDPWPKNRHAHRRLTHPRFVNKYCQILNEDGEIHFKTDSRTLFEFSLNSFADLGLRMRRIQLDVHADGTPPDHVFTEYELKFKEKGQPIYRTEVVIGEQALKRHLQALQDEKK